MNMLVNVVCRLAMVFQSTHFTIPAGTRSAVHQGNLTILPGGRVLVPTGQELPAGPGAFGLAVSPGGKVITSNIGPERLSLTYMEMEKRGPWLIHNIVTARTKKSSDSYKINSQENDEQEWKSVFMGITFSGEKSVWVAEGNSGRVRLVDVATGAHKRYVDLNTEGFTDSFTGDLALDPERSLLYVTDQANFRIAIIDIKKARVIASLKVGKLPFALALSEDNKSLYVTNIGLFEYKPLPGADKARARETGAPFPAGFPLSPNEIADRILAPGDPNGMESNSLAILNVQNPAAPVLDAFIRTGQPITSGNPGGSSPCGVAAGGGRIFVSNAHDDSITVIDAKTRKIQREITLRMPGLEALRGVMPLGMAYEARGNLLYAAAAGINAVAVVELDARRVSYVPVGWFPTRVVLKDDKVFVSNAKGHGTGPNVFRHTFLDSDELVEVLHRGSVSVFPVPAPNLAALTQTVLAANGFTPGKGPENPLPPEIRHVVLIVKENRTFDEVFGDVAGVPNLARFGATTGYADGGRKRFSLQRVNVTPNHHALAKQFTMGDNFYADSEVSVDGHHWLVGNYPDPWTESSLMASYAGQKDFRFPTTAPGRLLFAGSNSSVHPEEIQEAGTLWHHLERHNISFRNFGEGFELAGVDEGVGEKPFGVRYLTNIPVPAPLLRNSSRQYPGFNMNIPDQFRASQFIREMEEMYAKPGKPLPQFLFIHLPNDHMTTPRPTDGYPYTASYVADNDYALGRIVEYLSHSPWWNQMAIFVTEDDAHGGRDHIDSHRTVLLGAGPWFKKNYVTHVNSSFPGLLKTIFRLLGVPPLNLYDACAADLSDAFTTQPDFTPYQLQAEDLRLFDPAAAREPLDPKPSVRMDAR